MLEGEVVGVSVPLEDTTLVLVALAPSEGDGVEEGEGRGEGVVVLESVAVGDGERVAEGVGVIEGVGVTGGTHTKDRTRLLFKSPT